MISIFSSSRYKVNKKKLISSAEVLMRRAGIDAQIQINVAFVGIRKMRYLSSKYKKENTALPVLTFPLAKSQKDEPSIQEPVFAEIVICFPQAVLLAAERDKPVDKTILELIKHGIYTAL